VGTSALAAGLKAAGYASPRDCLAVLRSAFRLRPELGADQPFAAARSSRVREEAAALAAREGGAEHAAVLVSALAGYLTCDEGAAAAVLGAVDDMSRRRSGKVRPPLPGGAGAGAYTPAPALGSSGYYGGGATPARRGAGGMPGTPTGAPPGFGLTYAPGALPASVGEWVTNAATEGERENLVSLMALLGDFARRTGAQQPARPVDGAGDSVVVALGPRLKVGLRVYV
jgi:hypothetical protein